LSLSTEVRFLYGRKLLAGKGLALPEWVFYLCIVISAPRFFRCVRLFWLFALALFVATPVSAQIIVTNALVAYSYEQGVGGAFVPSAPFTSATPPTSTLSFFPTGFSALNSGSAWNIDTFSSVLNVTMNANGGNWFTNDALQLSSRVGYSLNAPTSTSSAGVSFTAPFTLYITEVDNSPFASPSLQLTDSLTVVPPFVETVGPGSFLTGTLSGDIVLSLNTIKAHFGIGPANNITGMRVQFSPVVSAWSERGSASAALVNFDVVNQVVPEPSTYALLMLGAGVVGAGLWRRRRS